MLAASAAFVGGGALAPTPAAAMFSNGPGACQFWIDCITAEETGGGGGGGSVVAPKGGGAGLAEQDPETIIVKEKKCGDPGKVCVGVGGPGGGDPQNDRDEIKRHEDGPFRGHPSCKRPSTGLEAEVCSGKKDKGKKEPKKEPPKKPKTALEVALEHAEMCRDLEQNIKGLERLKSQVAASTVTDRDMAWTRSPDPAAAKKEALDDLREAIKIEEKQFSDECAGTSA